MSLPCDCGSQSHGSDKLSLPCDCGSQSHGRDNLRIGGQEGGPQPATKFESGEQGREGGPQSHGSDNLRIGRQGRELHNQ